MFLHVEICSYMFCTRIECDSKNMYRGLLDHFTFFPAWNVLDSVQSWNSCTWTTAPSVSQKGSLCRMHCTNCIHFLTVSLQIQILALHLVSRSMLVIIGLKGWLWLVQHMPKKPTKWGMKAFISVDNVIGYTYNWWLYAKKWFNYICIYTVVLQRAPMGGAPYKYAKEGCGPSFDYLTMKQHVCHVYSDSMPQNK